MKLYIIEKGSTSFEGLRRIERPEPSLGSRSVLIRVRATSLNYRDLAVVTGQYFGGAVARDTIPLSDGAGEVVAVGPEVTRVKVGDRVAGTFFQGWIDGPPSATTGGALGSPLDGMLAEYVALDQDGVVVLPDSVSFEDAACLPCAGVTAWHALTVHHRMKPGDTVLSLGTGGVALFALQLGRLAGARVILTSSSDEKIERAKALGAWACVNYKTHPEWENEVLSLTSGRGIDHVVETGGAGTFGRSVQTLAYGGEISLIGVLAGPGGEPNLHMLMLKAGSARGIFVGSRRMFEDMLQAMDVNGLRPVIDRVFPFDEAPAAFEHLRAGRHMGKVVIAV